MGQYYRGSYEVDEVRERWGFIDRTMAREKGLFQLAGGYDYEKRCIEWFLQTTTDNALDMIELSFRVIDVSCSDLQDYKLAHQGIRITPKDAIEELNTRFKEHGIGYRYENREIIRMDSQYVHAEVMKPALALLQDSAFQTANQEFMAAHRHYRSGEVKDCIVACQRSFESTLKVICSQKKWRFGKGDRLPELIKIVRGKKLFPEYLDNGFDTYIAMLKTGLPGVRNNAGGHGSSPTDDGVPEYVAAYALHMTATNIILVVEAYKS